MCVIILVTHFNLLTLNFCQLEIDVTVADVPEET